MDVKRRVVQLVRQKVVNDDIKVENNTLLLELGLDSLTLVELISSIEDEFDIIFEDEEILSIYEWETLEDMLNFIESKVKN